MYSFQAGRRPDAEGVSAAIKARASCAAASTPPIASCLQLAIGLLAYSNMRTLYLRNVPDEVVAPLQRLAARDGTSVGAVAVRELAEVSRRADNAALLGSLPDLDVSTVRIVEGLEEERSER